LLSCGARKALDPSFRWDDGEGRLGRLGSFSETAEMAGMAGTAALVGMTESTGKHYIGRTQLAE
jgi:hypothetical protein